MGRDRAENGTMLKALGLVRRWRNGQLNRFLLPWPGNCGQYRTKGYWRGEPLTAMLARQCELAPDAGPFSAASAASVIVSWTPPELATR